MKTERLVVLLSKQEKSRITELAKARQTSVGELVRSALAGLTETAVGDVQYGDPGRPAMGLAEQGHAYAAPALSADQAALLERFAATAMQSMTRANAALDRAFTEIEATKAHFAAKQGRAAKQDQAEGAA